MLDRHTRTGERREPWLATFSCEGKSAPRAALLPLLLEYKG